MSAPNWWGDWRPILTPHTGNLQPTDLLECTMIVGGVPVNTAITGQQIIDAAGGGGGAVGYYAQYQDDITQPLGAVNVGQPTKFRTMDLSNGVTVNADTEITIANTGIYNLQFSFQFQNIDVQEHDVTVWLRKNGTDVDGSSGFVAVVSSHGGGPGHVIASWNYLLDAVGGDFYELMWSATSLDVTMEYYPAGSPPPSTASAIFTVTQQAGIIAGTGMTALNGLSADVQTISTGTTGTDFNVVSSGSNHEFNIPTASATNRGALSTTDWSTFNAKQDTLVSGTNIKTINGSSILGSGNLTISGSNIYTADGTLTAARTLTQGGFDLTIAGTTSSRFFSNGNVGIGTTTNAGFKLDVNGTARVSGALTLSSGTGVASSISYGSTYGLLVYGNTGSNSDLTLTDRGGNLRLRIVNGGNILQTATTINDVVIGGLSFTAKSIYTSSVYGLVLGGSAGSTYHFSLFESTGTNGFFIDSAGRAKVGAYNSAYNNSAILEAVSTTRGFLPPRMTNAQMLAIATPAAGLVVYDTTNNKHCGYNGTAWQNFY